MTCTTVKLLHQDDFGMLLRTTTFGQVCFPPFSRWNDELICPPVYALGLICFIPQAPPQVYLTQILRSIGFSTVSPVSSPKPAVSNALIVQHQSAYHSLQRFPHHYTPQYHLGQRKAEPTRVDWHLPTHLDTSLHHRSRILARSHQGEMGDFCSRHHATLVPILSCH